MLFTLIFQVKKEGSGLSLLTLVPCALDRISSYTVSLIKRHYSIDDVLSRVSFPLQLLACSALTPSSVAAPPLGGAVKPLPLLSF